MSFASMWESRVANPLGAIYGNVWVLLIIELMPLILEMIEKCSEDREGFASLAADPSDFQVAYFERNVRRRLRRMRVDIPQGYTFAAYQIVAQTFRAAGDMPPQILMGCYDSREAA